MRKVIGGVVGSLLDYIVSSHSFSSGLWILDFGLGFCTWILDLDFGLDLGLTISEPDIRNRHTPVEK